MLWVFDMLYLALLVSVFLTLIDLASFARLFHVTRPEVLEFLDAISAVFVFAFALAALGVIGGGNQRA